MDRMEAAAASQPEVTVHTDRQTSVDIQVDTEVTAVMVRMVEM